LKISRSDSHFVVHATHCRVDWPQQS
jgi:hypothetical protein